MNSWFKNIGPSTLITSAFIGPGTVILCSIAGAQYGFTLLWALLLSVLATIVLQEMAARLGIITQNGLAEVIRKQLRSPIAKSFAILLILCAIFIGNAAYEAGNISGASIGIHIILGNDLVHFAPIIMGSFVFVLLYIGNYKILERCLIALVLLMSLSFIITAIMTQPDSTEMIRGLFVPKIPKGSLWIIIGLVGTTIVPYNLFLHASLAKERWKQPEDLKKSIFDVLISISFGGLISMSILVCAASLQGAEIKSLSDLSKGLKPLYGSFATYFLSIGFFAAGITSAITAPLATAYVVNHCFGWDAGLKSTRFRIVWMLILGIGVVFSSLRLNFIRVIQFAQVSNGLLLPIVTVFLLWVMNLKTVLGQHTNSKLQNVLGILVIFCTLFLGIASISKQFGWF